MASLSLPTPSDEGINSLSDLRPAPLNFSRPRPVRVDSNQRLHYDQQDSTTKVISAFHEPNRDLPGEPRFSMDSDIGSTSTDNSVGSDFAWDAQRGELRSRKRPDEYEQNQRFTRPLSLTSSGSGNRSHGGNSDPEQLLLPVPSKPPRIPSKAPRILKRVSVDQRSERMSMTDRDWEDDASHHTVSVDGDAGYVPEGKWSSSEYDTSGLSLTELQKLKKKGINPALYAEMKAARKGRKKWVGPLVGNTFIG